MIVGVELIQRFPGQGTLRASTAGPLEVTWPWVVLKIAEGMRVEHWRVIHEPSWKGSA